MNSEQRYITDAFGLQRDMNLSYWIATNNDGTTSIIGPATSREMAKMVEEGSIKSATPKTDA
jgi:alkylated DNA nucleotide flippase Atl1